MKGLVKTLCLAIGLLSVLFGAAEARKFKDEETNKAIRNTRRVQQSYGSSRQIYLNFGSHFWRLDMRPPALEVGWEFIQSQPLLYKGVTWTAGSATPASTKQMKAYKMRIRLRAQAAVYIKSSFNIDKLFYNELIFDLDQFLSFLFADIIFVMQDQSVVTAGTATTPLWIPPWVYQDVNVCWAAGYNYNDITMSVETTFKYPNCNKMLISSLCDWSQWTSIITQFGSKQFLYGLLDECKMSDDNVMITAWEYSPVPQDSGDKLWTGNDIFSAPASGAPTDFQWYYNTPKTSIPATGSSLIFPTACFFSF